MLPARSGTWAVVFGGSDGHVVAADVDPAWVAEATAHDPVASPLGARLLGALADRVRPARSHHSGVRVPRHP